MIDLKQFPMNKLYVIDIEATCWLKGTQPKDQHNEIIEIGYSPIDLETLVVFPGKSILVKPTFSKVSKFCTELTTLTQEQVSQGVSFKEACEQISTIVKGNLLCVGNLSWSSWGDYDRTIFEDQCKREKVSYPFGKTHLNIKNLFALTYGLPRELGLSKSLKRCGIKFIGTKHRGCDDAFNTALILKDIFEKTRS